MTTRRVRRTYRRSEGGVNVAVDLDAVVSVNTGGDGRVSFASSTGTTHAEQHSARRRRTPDGETTRGGT